MALTFHQQRLDNGLTIIGEQNPDAQSMAVGYFVLTGARDESPEISGVSHFLEHMMFKGTARRSAADINREFDTLGARYNAYTSEDRTVYYGAVLPEHAAALVDLLTDMMRPALRPEDFEVEKKVILEEIAMYHDRPNFRVFDEASRRFFGSHPAGNSILGTAASITALTREQMLDYFRARYAPNNLLLVLAGAFDWDALTKLVAELTASWEPQPTERHYPPLEPNHGHELLADANVSRAHVAAYAPGVSAQDERRYAAALVASCLGDSSGSRLYWELVDKGLADSASLWHDAGDHVGTFLGYVSTAPEQLDAVLATFREVIAKAQQEGFRPDEWARAQHKLATGITLRGETPFGRLMSLGSSFHYLQRYLRVQDVVDAIMATPVEAAAELLASRPFEQLFTLALAPAAAAGDAGTTSVMAASSNGNLRGGGRR